MLMYLFYDVPSDIHIIQSNPNHILSSLHKARIINPIVCPERPRSTRTRHCALPQHSSLILFFLVLGQLTRDAVHNTTIMENDQVAFLPAMRIDILSCVDFALHAVDQFSDLLNVVHYCYFSSS